MQVLATNILIYAAKFPEGTPLTAKDLLHLGNRAAIDQTLSRLVKRGKLFRIGRGIYVSPIESRFGTHAPAVSKTISIIAEQKGETIVPSGATAANSLGLTTQVPVREVYLTSGPSRKLIFGAQKVELRHAPPWQLVPSGLAGEVVRALEWIGPKGSKKALQTLKQRLSKAQIKEVAAARRQKLPLWMAEQISTLVT